MIHEPYLRPADPDGAAAPACSLDREALATRLDEWAELRERALMSRERDGPVVTSRWRRADGVRDELIRLIGAEHRCCPFLGFELTVEPGAIRLRTTIPDGVGADMWESIG